MYSSAFPGWVKIQVSYSLSLLRISFFLRPAKIFMSEYQQVADFSAGHFLYTLKENGFMARAAISKPSKYAPMF
jgi:hypothetical protein